MQEINSLLNKAGKALKPHSDDSRTAAGRNNAKPSQDSARAQAKPAPGHHAEGPDLVDAINQLFAEFELAYHNQYHKAYGDPDRLVLAKKYWLECLSDFHPQLLVAAGRRLVKTQDYLPTISAIIRACEQAYTLYGLPSEREAYTEACRAPAPKQSYRWSHAAVYLAGKQTDWFMLACESEEKAFPVFAYYYRQLCQRVLKGEDLDIPVPAALQENPSRPLSHAEREKRLLALRHKLGV
jgi:hypothetical protein